MARSGPCISAIFASTSLSPAALSLLARASAFNSRARSFIAARSSSVNPFCVPFFAGVFSAIAKHPLGLGEDLERQRLVSERARSDHGSARRPREVLRLDRLEDRGTAAELPDAPYRTAASNLRPHGQFAPRRSIFDVPVREPQEKNRCRWDTTRLPGCPSMTVASTMIMRRGRHDECRSSPRGVPAGSTYTKTASPPSASRSSLRVTSQIRFFRWIVSPTAGNGRRV